jgi:nucleoside-diphosphate-sugar epimerase
MSKEHVLITGVNGYIAAVTAKHFLDHGHSVRGTVRTASSAQALIEGPLKAYFSSGKFTITQVPDITVPGAFDEAVKGNSFPIPYSLSHH